MDDLLARSRLDGVVGELGAGHAGLVDEVQVEVVGLADLEVGEARDRLALLVGEVLGAQDHHRVAVGHELLEGALVDPLEGGVHHLPVAHVHARVLPPAGDEEVP
ncbi:hypothetical protein D3C87_1792050 [compost metagenome]